MFIFANNRQTKQTVNKNAAILIALWSVCISYATSIFAATNPNRLDTLKVFVQKKILYNEEIPVDSVICWSESILPDIRKNKQDKTTYFLLQLQLANAYTLRGDISLAIDRARLMYEEAKEMEYDFGMVVANQAIGDAYTIANQCDKALESYQDALKELHLISPHHPYHIQLLLKQSNTLQRKGQLKDAKKVLDEIKNTLGKKPDYATTFFATIEEANYAISHGHLSRSYLKEAAGHLKSMDSIYRLHPEKFYYFHLKYTAAAYYRAMGNWDASNWDKAMQLYEELRQEYSVNKRSTYYRWITLETIYLYKIQGKSMEACRLYQELYPTVDTLTTEGYTRQINTLRAKYQVDQMEIANKEEHNRLITSMLAGSIMLLLMFTIIAFRLKKQQQKITLSTQNLERLRTNAENATSAKSIFLSNMSHEIRTPLNALSGFSSLLTEEGLDNETRRQCNDVILQNSELLLKLINDVIDLSSLEFGKIQFSKSLKSITLGKNIRRLEYSTFSDCTQLQEIHCLPITPPTITEFCFDSEVLNNCKLYIPKGTYNDYWIAQGWGDFKNIIEGDGSIDSALIIGNWKLLTHNGQVATHVTFNNDGTFLYTSVNDGAYSEHGIYKIENNILYEKFSDEDTWCMSEIFTLNSIALTLRDLDEDGITYVGDSYTYQRVE